MTEAKTHIPMAGMTPEDLERHLSRLGLETRYAARLLYWIYKRRISSFSLINDIPKSYLAEIAGYFTTGLSAPQDSVVSADKSIKYLFRNGAGLLFETVYIPEGKRHTVCVSVQSGCRMGCLFCATGSYGWRGNLTAGEIINQVLSIPHSITNVVFMGMGEAGDNIDEVIKACTILTAGWGLATGRQRVTVSTVGIIPSLLRLLNETECNITLSLHSPFSDERRAVIPAEARWPVRKAVEVMRSVTPARHRRFTVAYVMIKGVNDTRRHLDEIITLLSGSGIKINLLPYHAFDGQMKESTDPETMMHYKHILVTSGIEATVRRSRGLDIDAACGMLASRPENRE